MLIHVLNISFIDMLLHISYLFVLSRFIPYYLSFTFLLFVLITVYVSSYSNTMLLISCHLHILVIYLMFHAYKYLRSGYGNYKDPKVLLSLCETMNYKDLKVQLSLYETMAIYKGLKTLLSLYETMTIYKGPQAL